MEEELKGEPTERLLNSASSDLAELDFIRAEVNLLVFPFFALTTKGMRDRLKTEFRAAVERGGDRIEIAWTVSANPDYGYPGLFDREVHRAIEQVITQMLKEHGKVENPIRIGSLYDICERMGLGKRPGQQKYGGWEYRAIRRALERIATAVVKSEGTFYSKGERRWVSQVFHLYDAVVLRGERLRDGTIAETNYLYLSDIYLQSLNALYVKPIDYQYQRTLRSHIASRLYEILGVKFYRLRNHPEAEVCFRYSTVAQLLPVERCQYLAHARKQLNPAHEELVATGFLESYEWCQARDDKDWLIVYRPGPRAREEIQRAKAQKWLTGPGQEPLPGIEEEIEEPQCLPREAAEALSDEQRELVNALVALNVSEVTARHLVMTQDLSRVRKWVEVIPHVHARDKAAFLVKAIKEDWQLPEEYLRDGEEKERGEGQRNVEKARRKKEEEQKKLQQEEAQQLDRLYESLSPEQRAEVDQEVEARLPVVVRERIGKRAAQGSLSRPMAAIVKAKRREVVAEWLREGKIGA